MDDKTVRRILMARYGTLTSFDHAPIATIYKISARLRVPYQTVWQTLKTFHARGCKLDFRRKTGRRPRQFPPEVLE